MHASQDNRRRIRSRRTLLVILLTSLGIFHTALQVLAAAGDLDLTFGSGGKVTTDFGTPFDSVRALAIQQDGKIVAGGSALVNLEVFDGAFALARYNSNGSLDLSFGTGGKVITNLAPVSFQLLSAGATFTITDMNTANNTCVCR